VELHARYWPVLPGSLTDVAGAQRLRGCAGALRAAPLRFGWSVHSPSVEHETRAGCLMTLMNIPLISEELRAKALGFTRRPRELLIGGDWRPARSGACFDVIDPATGAIFAHAAAGDAPDVDQAVAAARTAFERSWGTSMPAFRARLLLKLADLIEANGDELALLETLDNGMPFRMARMAATFGAAESLRYHAGWATKIGGETINPSVPGEWHTFTLREPVGVVGQIVPWNFPLVMAVAKIAAALTVGCTVVLKPAEQTPLSAIRLGELVLEAGFPPGVVNIVTGFGETAGRALVAHPDVNKIAFTGSTPVGKEILRACAGNLKRVTLELGGKSPVIIFPDADLGPATDVAARGIFMNTGQVCAAGSRLFVHERVFDRVVEDAATDLGPVVSDEQRQRVTGYVRAGIEDGARVLTGGDPVPGPGFFMQPTVLAGTTAGMKVVREEIFGPVLCAMSFSDSDVDAIARLANDTDYGLAASIWTRDITVAHRLARRIKAGSVRINTAGSVDPAVPLGGFKQSGWGRENGREGTEIYTEVKSVTVGLT
jgi:acyl-CoA reductase-like NAD-dependent aldehyde dehydrogenase